MPSKSVKLPWNIFRMTRVLLLRSEIRLRLSPFADSTVKGFAQTRKYYQASLRLERLTPSKQIGHFDSYAICLPARVFRAAGECAMEESSRVARVTRPAPSARNHTDDFCRPARHCNGRRSRGRVGDFRQIQYLCIGLALCASLCGKQQEGRHRRTA